MRLRDLTGPVGRRLMTKWKVFGAHMVRKGYNLRNFGSLPNMLTLARLILTPVVITMVAADRWVEAFAAFALAGVTDALDGWLAKKFDLRTEIGAMLDPIADKALLVSLYVALGVAQAIPPALAILVVSRDMMIVGGVVLAWVWDNPVKIRPLFISKANTAAQIAFVTAVLASKAFGFSLGPFFPIGVWTVAALTLASAIAYLARWFKHMNL